MPPIMEAKNIVKVYPGTVALKGVDFDIQPGEVHALIGENGAGKSTLMKILAGVEQPTSGQIFLNGKEVHFASTLEAASMGVGIIHQELNLFQEMTIADDMFAGNEISHFGIIDRPQQRKRATEILSHLQLYVDPNEVMKNLRVGQQQIIEIGKTMIKERLRVLIMDEPTSSLSNAEVEVLFKLIAEFKSQGIAIVYISHRLEEIMRVCDRVTVLRDGSYIDSAKVKDIEIPWIIDKMVGHSTLTISKTPYKGEKAPVLEVKNYKLPRLGGGYTVDNVSFTLNHGEVLGIYGLMGAGRTELAESLMGLHSESSGEMILDGKKIEHPVVSEQIANGMVLVPEDRQRDGLVQKRSIFDNMRLMSLDRLSTVGVMNEKESRKEVDKNVSDLHIKVADVNSPVTALSGGNQQKVVIGKCVMANAKVFMMDEPSRGIDVGAKTEIFNLMRGFALQGMGVLFIGSELKEIMSVCDRVLVMSNGKITADLTGDEITEEALVTASAANLHTGRAH